MFGNHKVCLWSILQFRHYSAIEFLCITTASNFQSFKCYCTDPVISHDPTLITWQKDRGAQSLTGLKTFVFMSMMPSRNVDSDADQEWGYFFFWPSDLAKAQFFNIEHWNRNFHQLCNYNEGISCDSHNPSCLAQNLTFPALTLKTSTDLSLRSQQKKKKSDMEQRKQWERSMKLKWKDKTNWYTFIQTHQEKKGVGRGLKSKSEMRKKLNQKYERS